MGLWSTIKGWLNIGGVKVLLWKYTEPLSKSNPVITGSVLLKTKSEKTITAVEVKVIEEIVTTEGEGEDKTTETETNVLGSVKFPSGDPGIGYPIDLKPGADKEQAFELPVAVTGRLKNYSTSTFGKFASMGSNEKITYYLVADVSIKGAAFSTSAKEKLKIAE